MKNLIKKVKGESNYVTYIKKRLRLNLNFICMFTGSTGIGKTWNAIKLSEKLDPSFDAEKQITFDFEQTIKLINSDWFKQKKIKVILWDEPQTSISNREWQSLTNKLVNYLLSTFRSQNIVLIWATPYQDFLDSQSMKLLHCIFECQGVNRKTNSSLVKPKLLQYNASLKKTYYHPLYVIHEGGIDALREWHISKPSKHLIDVYERLKDEFNTKLNLEIEEKLNSFKHKQDPTVDSRKPLTDKQEEIMMTLANNTAKETMRILNYDNINIIYFHKRQAEKKGYKLNEFEDIRQNAKETSKNQEI